MYWWVPLVLAAASYGANYAGQKKTDRARGRALEEANRIRGDQSEKAAAAARKTADLFEDHQGKEDAAAAKNEAALTEATEGADAQTRLSDALTDIRSPTATSFVNEEQTINDKRKARTAERAKSLAQLGAFGNVMGANEIASARNRQDIGQAGTTMQNWMEGVLPLQLEAANQAGRDYHTLADVLQVASMLTGVASMSTPAAGAGQAAGQGANVARDTAVLNAQMGREAATRAANYAAYGPEYGAIFRPPVRGAIY